MWIEGPHETWNKSVMCKTAAPHLYSEKTNKYSYWVALWQTIHRKINITLYWKGAKMLP